MAGKPCRIFENKPDFLAGASIAGFIDEQALVVCANQDDGAGLVAFAGKKDREMLGHKSGDSLADKLV